MKNKYINAFWIGFLFTVGLTVWIYWIWRQKRVVAPKPLVVTRRQAAQPVAAARRSAAPAARTQVSDALEEIKGIGPVIANRLNEAGIFTFAQLALAAPEDLARIAGAKRWDPADWIAEATKLSAGEAD